jgi:alcohol dehydrogenase
VRARAGREDESEDVLAQKFVDAVQRLNDDLGIPRHLDALREQDIPSLAEAACAEANTYPVPRYMTQAQCEALIRQVLPPKTPHKTAQKAPPKPAAKKRRSTKAAA